MRVLLIEDDAVIAKSIEVMLGAEGIVSDVAELGEDGRLAMRLNKYDLVILDLMLPDMSGYDLLKSLRKSNSNMPVMILSGLAGSEQKIKCLAFGADDYLTKPFNNGELVARVKAIVRRSKGHATSLIKVANMSVDLNTHTTAIGGRHANLTNKEQSLIELMALKKGSVISKETFFNHLYNGMDEPELKIIDVFICKMRKKLFDLSGGLNYIETVWGRGYSLKEPDQIPENQRMILDDNVSNIA